MTVVVGRCRLLLCCSCRERHVAYDRTTATRQFTCSSALLCDRFDCAVVVRGARAFFIMTTAGGGAGAKDDWRKRAQTHRRPGTPHWRRPLYRQTRQLRLRVDYVSGLSVRKGGGVYCAVSVQKCAQAFLFFFFFCLCTVFTHRVEWRWTLAHLDPPHLLLLLPSTHSLLDSAQKKRGRIRWQWAKYSRRIIPLTSVIKLTTVRFNEMMIYAKRKNAIAYSI